MQDPRMKAAQNHISISCVRAKLLICPARFASEFCLSDNPARRNRLIIAALAVVMLLAGFGTVYALKPTTTETSTYVTVLTSTYTTTITPSQGANLLNCVVSNFQVLIVSNGTNQTGSVLETDYTTTTSVGHPAGYSTTTTTSILNSGGPAWNSTVCTWLPR